MDPSRELRIQIILETLQRGSISPEEAVRRIKRETEGLGGAQKKATQDTNELTKALDRKLGKADQIRHVFGQLTRLFPGFQNAAMLAFSPITGALAAVVGGFAVWLNHLREAKQRFEDMQGAIAAAAGSQMTFLQAQRAVADERANLRHFHESWRQVAEQADAAATAAETYRDAIGELIASQAKNQLTAIDLAQSRGQISAPEAARRRYLIQEEELRRQRQADTIKNDAVRAAKQSKLDKHSSEYTAAVEGYTSLGGAEGEADRAARIKFLKSAQDSMRAQIKAFEDAMSQMKPGSEEYRTAYTRKRGVENLLWQDDRRIQELEKQQTDASGFLTSIKTLAEKINQVAAEISEPAKMENATKALKAQQEANDSQTRLWAAQIKFNEAMEAEINNRYRSLKRSME